MSEYTPSEFEPFSDEEMREIFLDRDLEEWAKLNPQHRNASGEDWDRWLAAHDAEVLHRAALFLRGSENPRQSDNTVQAVRHSMDDAGYELLQLSKRVATGAGVVTEEPEWEYGYRPTYAPMHPEHPGEPMPEIWPTNRKPDEFLPGMGGPYRRTKMTPAGPWEPVEN